MRVLEWHPGGGQYDLLSIFRVGEPGTSVFGLSATRVGDFNLLSGEMRGHGLDAEESVPWLSMWSDGRDIGWLADIANQTFGLPVIRTPRYNRRTFGCALIAKLLRCRMTRENFLEARMGFVDTSGYGSGVSTALRPFTTMFRPKSTEDEIDAAADCWLVYEGSEDRLVAAVRMDGHLSPVTSPSEMHDLYTVYLQNRDMSKVLAKASEIIGDGVIRPLEKEAPSPAIRDEQE